MAIRITAAEKKILQDVTIPPRPEALLKVSQEAKQPEPDVAEIAKAIASDIGISAAVLQVVNSAAFRRTREIKSIDQAVMVLGLKRVFPIVKAVALKSAMSASDELNQFWQDSTDIANVCALVSNQLDKPQLGDNAYMLGLFHAAGIPVMFLNFQDYAKIMHQAESEGWSDELLEQENLLCQTNHTTIGALLGQRWKLAKDLIEVIYYQHDCSTLFSSTELSKVGLWLLAILKISRHIVVDLQQGKDVSPEWEAVRDPILEFLKIDDGELDYVIETVRSNIN
ncbi:HDOD domain-containing protein [Catenovulum maritimum]|uniref:Histidine kinase n=1 Tax=Catenovulum maritimum TaxID=1513271 RepID=A0A0J8GVS1_9ALTE|nr:HDOD domain-containing protein [Catenovulum maritimum]KMT65414.1 histidine kinase [Catenovulum maritimum]